MQVRAQNAAGESSWSPSATATPIAGGLTMSVSPSPSTDGSYTVSWGVTRCFEVWDNEVCRTLQERVGSSGTWNAVSGVGTSATSHDFSGKTDGTTYYYRLVFGSGSTAVVVGGPVSVTVDEEEEEDDPPAKPAAPTVATGTGQLTVSWTAPDGQRLGDYRVRGAIQAQPGHGDPVVQADGRGGRGQRHDKQPDQRPGVCGAGAGRRTRGAWSERERQHDGHAAGRAGGAHGPVREHGHAHAELGPR